MVSFPVRHLNDRFFIKKETSIPADMMLPNVQ
jgi:hypothetical protein